MLRTIFVVLAGLGLGLMVSPGCSKKSGKGQPSVETKDPKKPGAASAEEAAKGFVAAAGRRDKAEMIRLLLGEAVCQARPERREKCLAYVKELRGLVPDMMKEFPKGVTAERVELKDMPGAQGQNVKLALVHPKGGGKAFPLMLMEHSKRFYVGVGIKKKSQGKK